MTGLQSIPQDITEAAQVDGSGRFNTLLHITLPLLRKTIALSLILSVVGSMLAFDQFFIMTGGGPQNQTITVVYKIYNTSFVSFDLGYGSAMSVVPHGHLDDHQRNPAVPATRGHRAMTFLER